MKFTIYWFDGTRDVVEGNSIKEAVSTIKDFSACVLNVGGGAVYGGLDGAFYAIVNFASSGLYRYIGAQNIGIIFDGNNSEYIWDSSFKNWHVKHDKDREIADLQENLNLLNKDYNDKVKELQDKINTLQTSTD